MLRLAMFVGFALIIVSVFLTWSDNPPFSQTGIERAGGLFAFVVTSGAALIALVDRRPRGAIIAVSASVLVLIASVYELLDISSGAGSAGAGVFIAVAGAIVASASSAVLTFGMFKKPVPP